MDRTTAPQRHVVLIPSAAYLTASGANTGEAFRTHGRKGAVFWVNVTADPDTVSIVAKVQGFDDTAQAWFDITGVTFAAIAAVGLTFMQSYPGLVETANVYLSALLPETIRVVVTPTGGTTLTYSVEADLIH